MNKRHFWSWQTVGQCHFFVNCCVQDQKRIETVLIFTEVEWDYFRYRIPGIRLFYTIHIILIFQSLQFTVMSILAWNPEVKLKYQDSIILRIQKLAARTTQQTHHSNTKESKDGWSKLTPVFALTPLSTTTITLNFTTSLTWSHAHQNHETSIANISKTWESFERSS